MRLGDPRGANKFPALSLKAAPEPCWPALTMTGVGAHDVVVIPRAR